MSKILKTLAIAAFVLALSAGTAAAAPTLPSMDLPSGVKIEKDDDMSAALLSQLYGEDWRNIAGGKMFTEDGLTGDAAKDSLGGSGRFSGVVVAVLGTLNLIAMAFVASAILYMWGIFAVTTAHEGKKLGGSVYNSLWVPVRHAASFSLAVPITGSGLSLLQVGILACISLSINTANAIWDGAGSYLVEHAQTGIIDNTPPFIEEESMALVRPAFRALVAQELVTKTGEYQVVTEQNFPSGTVNKDRYKSIQVKGRYAIVHEPLNGRLTIYPLGRHRQSLGDLGGVQIPAPIAVVEKGKVGMGPDPAVYRAQWAVTQARAEASIQLMEGLRPWAQHYLFRHGFEFRNADQRPKKDALELVRDYRNTVMDKAQEGLATIRKTTVIQSLLDKAIDNRDGKSRLGWVSAGLMPYTYAKAQERIDSISFNGSASYLGAGKALEMRWFNAKEADTALKGAYAWASDELLQGRLYNPVAEGEDGVSAINRLIAGVFLSEDSDNEGILSSTLSMFRRADPVIIMSNFGRQLYEVGSAGAIISLGGAAMAWVPFAGDAFAAVATNPFLVGLMTLFLSVGVALLFAAPIAVLAMWLWAILKWILMVAWVMTAAPFWAVVHACPEGPGFAGTAARQGYFQLLELVCRPVVLVVGAITSMGLWIVASILYNTLFAAYFNGFTAFNGGGTITELVLAMIVMISYSYLYLKLWSFNLHDGPALIPAFFNRGGGGAGGIMSKDDSDGSRITGTVGAAGAKAGGMVGQGAAATADATKGIKKAGQNMYEKAKERMATIAEARDGSVEPGDKQQ